MSESSSSQVYAELRSFVASIGPVPPDELLDDVSLIEQGAVDSLGLVEIQLHLETRLGREIQPEEFNDDTLVSITSIVGWLSEASRDAARSGR